MKELWACLYCGFIHDGKLIVTNRYDSDGGDDMHPSEVFHGLVMKRKCPKCGHEQTMKYLKD